MWHSPDESVPPGLKTAVERAVEQSNILGICVGIYFAGQSYFFCAGRSSPAADEPISLETRFKTGCLMKVLGASVVLDLCARGTLELEAPISRYLPEFENNRKGAEIRIAHLLSHTPGYSAINSVPPTRGWSPNELLYERILSSEQLFEPGRVFSYQNSVAVLLSDIVRRATGRTLPELVDERILAVVQQLRRKRFPDECERPEEYALGHAWSQQESRFVEKEQPFQIHEIWEPAVSSRICTTVPDFLSYCEQLVHANGNVSGSESCLSRRTVSEMCQTVVVIPRGSDNAGRGYVPTAYGLGLGQYFGGWFGHDGTMPGQSIGFRVLPKCGCAVVVGMNSGDGAPRQRVFDAVLSTLPTEESSPAPIVSGWNKSLAELQGTYIGRDELRVSVAALEHELILSMSYKDRVLVRMIGSLDDSGYFTPRKTAGVTGDLRGRICYTFFPEPGTNDPCLMMGVTALKKSS